MNVRTSVNLCQENESEPFFLSANGNPCYGCIHSPHIDRGCTNLRTSVNVRQECKCNLQQGALKQKSNEVTSKDMHQCRFTFTKRRTKPGLTRPRLTVQCGVRSLDCMCIVANVLIISTAPEKQRVVDCVACINAAVAKVALCAILVSCGINHLRGGIIKHISSLFSTINMAAFKQLECIVCFW